MVPLVLLAGCVTGGGGPTARDPVPAAPYVIYVALPELGYEGSPAPDRWPGNALALDDARIETALEQASEDALACTRLEVIRASRDPLAAARRGEADLLIELEPVERPTYRFKGRSAIFLPNTLLWFLTGLPSFWVKDRVYEIRWNVNLRVLGVPSGKPLSVLLSNSLEEELALHVADRGWTLAALYTPPGFYEGPHTARALAPHAERWLADRILQFIEVEARSPRLPFSVEIDIREPENLSRVPRGKARLVVEIRSPTPLESLRVDVDGETILARSPLTMPAARRVPSPGSGETSHHYRLALPLAHLGEGAHRSRVLARPSGQVENGAPGRAGEGTVSKTVGFEVTKAPEGR